MNNIRKPSFTCIDAAGQYAVNLEQFSPWLDLPMTLSIGEPKRNKDYQKGAFSPRGPPTTPRASR